jgi:hypothetical protein
MSGCIALNVTVPQFSVPGIEFGFGIPNLNVDADLCCKINVGPFPNIPPISVPIPLPTAVVNSVNVALMAVQVYIDSILDGVAISCPLD